MHPSSRGPSHSSGNHFQAWLETHAVAGPQRSYPLACRLAERMRPLGRTASIRADWALAHTLFCHGRLEKSQVLLSAINLDAIRLETDVALDQVSLALLISAQMSWNLALLGDTSGALEQAARVMQTAKAAPASPAEPTPANQLFACHALSQLHCFLALPEAALAWSLRAQAVVAASADPALLHATKLLAYWALSHLGQATDEASAQTALAALRRLGPAHEARAFSLYVQGLFRQSPAHAVTQLDAALDLNARCGLHFWTARLLYLKSRSLDAAGQLGEASRFLALAHETAQQQGARLFLDDITGIESRTYASPHRIQS